MLSNNFWKTNLNYLISNTNCYHEKWRWFSIWNHYWTIPLYAVTNTPFISPNSQSLRTELHFQFIRFAAAILQCASVCFHTEHRISAFWKVRFKKRSKIEQKDIITPMHCLAFPSALFGAPFHIDNRTVADCGFWLEYASKTPLEVVADLPHRMRLFWLRCQIMRLRSVHIKPHYSQNAFDSALLAWYERGISSYTERQKKLITSSECHSLKSKASTWIMFGHRLDKFILNKHI